MATCLAAVIAILGAASPPAVAPTPTPLPRLHLDIGRHVQKLFGPEVPRFQVEVVTRTPQQALEEHLKGFDPACGPGGTGAPTVAEMAPYRPHGPVGLEVNVTKLIESLKNSGPDRYFLYRVTRAEGVSYLVHEGRLPWSQLIQAGATLEPIGAFADRGTATRAWRRMERGYRTMVAMPRQCGEEPK